MTDDTTLAATPGDDVVVAKNEEVFEPESLDPQKPGDAEAKPEPKEAVEGDDLPEGDKPGKIPGSRREKIKNDILRRELADTQRKRSAGLSRRQKPLPTTRSRKRPTLTVTTSHTSGQGPLSMSARSFAKNISV